MATHYRGYYRVRVPVFLLLCLTALTVLYPTYASTFIFGALIGRWAYGTPINLYNVAGMLLLIAGMYLMGRQ